MPETKESSYRDGIATCESHANESEHDAWIRLTMLVEHLFRVPIAYIAMLHSELGVSTRIGAGAQYEENLKTFRGGAFSAESAMWPDPSGAPVVGFDPGELKFAAMAPLRASDGLHLGVLVIADIRPRPEFLARDLETLAELAAVLTGKMELRLMVHVARESEASVREAEERFRSIADAAPLMIIYSDADGGSSFVNRTWLEFTGRSLTDELGDAYAESFHPDHRDRVVQVYWSAFADRTALKVAFPIRRYDGQYRWVEARGTPRFRDDGKYAGYIGCLTELASQPAEL